MNLCFLLLTKYFSIQVSILGYGYEGTHLNPSTTSAKYLERFASKIIRKNPSNKRLHHSWMPFPPLECHSATFNAPLWSQLFWSVGSECDVVCSVNRVLLVLLVLMVCLLLHGALLRTSTPPRLSGATPLQVHGVFLFHANSMGNSSKWTAEVLITGILLEFQRNAQVLYDACILTFFFFKESFQTKISSSVAILWKVKDLLNQSSL